MDTYRIGSSDGEIEAVHHGQGSGPYVFLCHGFGSDKEGSHRERAEFLAENGFSAVRFDFRGNGGSTGEFAEQTLSSRMEDLVSVVRYFEPEDYALFGSSFGGKVAYFASDQLNSELLTGRAPALLDRVMNSYRVQVDRNGVIELFDGKSLGSDFFEDLDKYSFGEVELRCPFQIFQGGSDIYVPVQQSREALTSLDTRIEYHELPAERHSFSEEAESEMRQLWLAALRRHLT